jgi:sterol desaturase/sphingolipid hydroxylase (fatty acid hydroxylase superfamily)
MPIESLAYCIPVFALALALEAWTQRSSRRALISGLGCVALDQIVAGWGLAVFIAVFAAIHDRLAVTSSTSWLVAIGLHDLAYYAFHRASHRVTVLWAAHVVHHQSERYDFTVSLRQGAVATWVSYAFYLPLALVIDARTFVIVHVAYQVYQFFVHTRWVRALGPLEHILATPSHHRVHHGSERRHLDRNYGGFFIVFDRLLGTFTREDREPSYGVPGGFSIASPLAATSYMYLRLLAASRGLSARARLALWLGPPERTAAHVSSAAYPPRVVETAALVRTWLPLALGLAGAGALALATPRLPLAIVIAIASVVLVEWAIAPLDGRR